MSPSWIWSDKITNERIAQVGYNHFISNKGKWNNCFSKFSNRVLPPIFISTIWQRVRKEKLAHYFPYDVKLRLLAHSRSFLANQKARNAIVGAENLLNLDSVTICWIIIANIGLWSWQYRPDTKVNPVQRRLRTIFSNTVGSLLYGTMLVLVANSWSLETWPRLFKGWITLSTG